MRPKVVVFDKLVKLEEQKSGGPQVYFVNLS